MGTITIKDYIFECTEVDGKIMVTFETFNKVTVEMEYSRDEFLKYFSKDYATNLEFYLQKKFPQFK